MTPENKTLSTGITGQTISTRVASIDIFRGMTMAVMIFVNELSSVRGLPAWTEHAPGNVNRMTYVDMVFPFFLFILGVSLPIAITQRLKRHPSLPQLWVHVILRSLSLVVLGLILANAEKADAARMHLNGSAWAALALLGAALYLNVYSHEHPRFYNGLRWLGLAVLIVLLAIFRRAGSKGSPAWLDFSYPEILGLIGFAYLAASILYIPTRRRVWAPCAWLVLLITFCSLSTAKLLHPGSVPLYLWPFGNGAMPSVIIAGVVASSIFLGSSAQTYPRQAMLRGLGFGLVLIVAGYLLAPLGISKIRATPTWCLYSAGAGVLLFTALYWLCDVKKHTAWAAFLRPAGSNTLLTYLLPDLWYFFFLAAGISFFDMHLASGFPGVLKSLLFTALMLTFAALLTRARVRLQL